jgi:hypothetical protein
VTDRAVDALARRIQELADSGDFEGFNAIVGSLTKSGELDAQALAAFQRNGELKRQITDRCQDAWNKKHRKR